MLFFVNMLAGSFLSIFWCIKWRKVQNKCWRTSQWESNFCHSDPKPMNIQKLTHSEKRLLTFIKPSMDGRVAYLSKLLLIIVFKSFSICHAKKLGNGIGILTGHNEICKRVMRWSALRWYCSKRRLCLPCEDYQIVPSWWFPDSLFHIPRPWEIGDGLKLCGTPPKHAW